MEKEIGPRWADSLVIASSVSPQSSREILTLQHARIPSEADQLLSNWEETEVSIGSVSHPAVIRTVILLASAYDSASPVINTAMPIGSDNRFKDAGFILYSRECVKSGYSLEPTFRVDRRTYIKKITVIANDYDEEFGQNLQTKQILKERTEVVIAAVGPTPAVTIEAAVADNDSPYWGLQSNGITREGRRLSEDWYVVTEREIIPATIAAGGRSYYTSVNFHWPAVLSGVTARVWTKREGGAQTYAEPEFSKEEYRGPCKAFIQETFSVTAPAVKSVGNPSGVAPPESMLPLPIVVQSPFFGISVKPTLHTALTFTILSGTTDPVYEYSGGVYNFPATTPPSRPASVVDSDEVRPFRGGYMRTKVTVYQPEYPAP
jgi:hypothetical protein